MRTGISITLKPVDRRRLKALARDRNTPHKHVWRAEIVLLSADGIGTNEIMRRTGKSKTCVWRWQERFMQAGYDSLLHDKTRPSRIPPLGSNIIERVVALTQTDPPTEATHWTSAMMAKVVDISASSVQRIWRAHGLQPHRVKQFKLSTDPRFVDKLRDVVGLYVDPPAHAVVLSVDEKSQIQALDRTQPGLPMKKGRAGTMTHDYKRHGTTTLFAALSRPTRITCALPNPEPWVSKSATNSPSHSAAVIIGSCIRRAMRWPGGRTCILMRWRLPRGFGRKAGQRQIRLRLNRLHCKPPKIHPGGRTSGREQITGRTQLICKPTALDILWHLALIVYDGNIQHV